MLNIDILHSRAPSISKSGYLSDRRIQFYRKQLIHTRSNTNSKRQTSRKSSLDLLGANITLENQRLRDAILFKDVQNTQRSRQINLPSPENLSLKNTLKALKSPNLKIEPGFQNIRSITPGQTLISNQIAIRQAFSRDEKTYTKFQSKLPRSLATKIGSNALKPRND